MTGIKLVHVDTLSCEAIFRIAPNGDYIIISQCGDVTEPAPKNRVYIFKSKDLGKTWSKPVSIYPEDGKAVYATEVWVHDGIIDVFLTTHNGKFVYSKTFVMRSYDDGETFEKLDVLPEWEGLIFIRGVIRLKSGKYLIPFQRHKLSKLESDILANENKYFMCANISFAEVGAYLCDEFPGKLVESNTVKIDNVINGERAWKWPEPTAVELSNGDVKMLLRVDATGFLHEIISHDGGKTWGGLSITDLENPGNKPKLIKLSNGKIALINSFNKMRGFAGRKPLSVWISDDDMKTWSYKKISVGFDGWLSYPDGVESADGKKILYAFDFNRHDVYFVEHEI